MSKCDRNSKCTMFMCGVCEGFYGKPWTVTQRLELFRRMQRFRMNTYLYAPKDDYKHRLDWREKYTDEEADELRQLISAADACHVNFVYALSPGLDIVYSSQHDMNFLKDKLDQVKGLGCRHFALLFDDIDEELCSEDHSRFSSPAMAQSVVTNAIFSYLNEPEIFLFCPTEYCTTRAEPDLSRSSYLKTVGKQLHPKIDFLWTGYKVVSQQITVESIEAVSQIVQRKITIWDNLHANDYDQTRLYLGPYSGRESKLAQSLRGVLTNPNCEFEVNFIAFHTLAQWSIDRNTCFTTSHAGGGTDITSAMEMEVDSELGHERTSEKDEDVQNGSCAPYDAKQALLMAIVDWLPELYKTKTSCGRLRVTSTLNQTSQASTVPKTPCSAGGIELQPGQPSTGKEEAMSPDGTAKILDAPAISAGPPPAGSEPLPPDIRSSEEALGSSDVADSCETEDGQKVNRKVWEVVGKDQKVDIVEYDRLSVDDLVLICHLFYLPYEHGPQAQQLLESALWLLDHVPPALPAAHHSDTPTSSSDEEDARYEWYQRAARFHRSYRQVAMAVDKLVNIPNRELLYDLYSYVTDMRSTLALMNSYIKWLGMDKPDKDHFKSGDQEPWVYRGGLLAEFRSLLPIDNKHNSPSVSRPAIDVPSAVAATSSSTKGPFVIRPFFASDKISVYQVCEKLFANNESLPSSRVIADWYVGGLLNYSPELCYVMEDSDLSVRGYVALCLDASLYQKHFTDSWIPSIKAEFQDLASELEDKMETVPEELLTSYPSMISLASILCTDNVAASLRLLQCAVNIVKAKGKDGVLAIIPKVDPVIFELYMSSGFEDISTKWSRKDQLKVVGKRL